jgi:hypothetical protein
MLSAGLHFTIQPTRDVGRRPRTATRSAEPPAKGTIGVVEIEAEAVLPGGG